MIQDPAEMLETGYRLVIWYLMACLVDSCETEVAVFPHLTILDTVDDKGGIACCCKSLRIRIVCCERNSFSSEPRRILVLPQK